MALLSYGNKVDFAGLDATVVQDMKCIAASPDSNKCRSFGGWSDRGLRVYIPTAQQMLIKVRTVRLFLVY